MNFSPRQEAAFAAVRAWLDDPSTIGPVFRLFGYAGTGKTTLARHLVEGVSGLVQFAAFTGKAASVMRQRGCLNATTIHSLIYRPRPKSGEYLRELTEELKNPEITPERRKLVEEEIAKEKVDLKKPSFVLKSIEEVSGIRLFVIDECSMVDAKMADDLLSFGIPVLVLGDPAQLPPVRGTGYFTDAEPNVMLTEIHRQAADSPVIALATAVREGRSIGRGKYGESVVLKKADLAPGQALAHDQILVGRNATRTAANRRARELKGLPGVLPVAGDRLVCLRNDHEVGVLNGQIWSVRESSPIDDETLALTIEGEGLAPLTVEAHTAHFEGRELGWERMDALEFDYGYALTVHKAQGSQWGSVILFDESYCFRQDARRWLYTGITRAAERVTIVVS